MKRLQNIQNALARAVTKTPKHHHITPVLKSLHWLKIPERISYKIASLTYNTIQSSQPSYFRNIFSINTSRPTRSSSYLTLERPAVTSSLKFCDRSLQFAAPRIWNELPPTLRQLSSNETSSTSVLSAKPSQFHSLLKRHFFDQTYPEDSPPKPKFISNKFFPP